MRGRLINWACAGTLIAYLAIGVAIVASEIYLNRHSTHPAVVPSTKFNVVSGNKQLLRDLARCQALGGRAQDDQACIAAWIENRRRFFGGAPKAASSTQSARMSHP
jgi:conjugative transfer region protein TrbK